LVFSRWRNVDNDSADVTFEGRSHFPLTQRKLIVGFCLWSILKRFSIV